MKIGPHEVHAKIDALANLPDGWHYGSGIAPQHSVRAIAKHASNIMRNAGIERFQVFPGVTGEVQVAGYTDGTALTFTVENENTADLLIEEGGQKVLDLEDSPTPIALSALKHHCDRNDGKERHGM